MIESVLNESIPECVKTIMHENGFNSHLSLMSINSDAITNMEKYTNSYLTHAIANLNCCVSDIYKSQVIKKKFEFAPGHRLLIMNIPKRLEENCHKTSSYLQSREFSVQLDEISARVKNEPALSNVLKELVQNAIANFGKPSNRNEYSETMKYFSAYS